MTTEKSINELKVGDTVAVGKHNLTTVIKVAATQVVCERNQRYRRDSGKPLSSSGGYISANPADIEAVRQLQADEKRRHEQELAEKAQRDADPRFQAASRLSNVFGMMIVDEIAERFTLDQLRAALTALGLDDN